MTTWQPDYLPEPRSYGMFAWLRIAIVWLLLAAVIYGLLLVLLLVRLFEWPFGRPITPEIVKLASRVSLWVLGIRCRVKGSPMRSAGAVVANHVSWLDILVLNSRQRVHFVAKSEVRNWFGFGILTRATGTVFIDRDPRKARQQQGLFTERFREGDTLLFFPEGTSTDGMRVLRFKPTLFASLFDESLQQGLLVQPVTLTYRSPPDEVQTFFGFWGAMELGDHMIKVCSAGRGGSVELTYHAPIKPLQFQDRKSLAIHCESVVRAGLAA